MSRSWIAIETMGLNTWYSDNSVSFKSLSISGIFKNVSILRSAHCLCLVCAWTPWLPSTAQNRCIFKSTTNKSMLLLSLHQLFRPNVYLLQVGKHTHNTNIVTSTWYCKKKMSWIFFNFQIFTTKVGLQWLLETEMWNTKEISKQFLKKIWIIFTSQEDKAYRRVCQNKIIKLL